MPEPDGTHFDRVATVYERGRPPYPSAVYDLLTQHGLVGEGVRVLEVGAGSGLATVELLARGCRVDAVEPGPNLAAALRRLDHPRLTVLEASIEDVELAEGEYDVVVAATSLHWVDLDRSLPLLHRALRPGGSLAVWWAVFGDPDWHTPFRDRVDEITREGGIWSGGTPRPLQAADRMAELAAGGLFGPREPSVIQWPMNLTVEQVRDLFTTFPRWSPELVDQVADAAADCGGVVEEHYLTVVYLADRLDV